MLLELVEKELVREGEKLSDLLSMPVKDALGRELSVSYAGDIVNVREVLDMTTARRQLFRDSVELQRLTLQQATHVHDYEKDAVQVLFYLLHTCWFYYLEKLSIVELYWGFSSL